MRQIAQSLEEEVHEGDFMKSRSAWMLFLMLSVVSLSPVVPTSHAEGIEQPLRILTAWSVDEMGEHTHAYILEFEDTSDYEVTTSIKHERNGIELETATSLEWLTEVNVSTALLEVNTTLEWGDSLTVLIEVVSKNNLTLSSPMMVERSFEVGTWNEPLADHEVLMQTEWKLDQAFENDQGNQSFLLEFNGQGWQQRLGNLTSSSERGDGTYRSIETNNGTQTLLDLTFHEFWKNETRIEGVLSEQYMNAEGTGEMEVMTEQGSLTSLIEATISQALLNRSTFNGVVSEHLKLEATGDINIVDESSDARTEISGELVVFYFESIDQAGVRILEHNQFEAMADMKVIDDTTRMDVELDGFLFLERWEGGVRVSQLEEVYGDGTFGFADSDENASMVINGTILDLHTKIENGVSVIDNLHVDGTLSGDVQGTFGVLRYIEDTGEFANLTGDMILVNVIYQQNWFNLTGVNGGNFFGGAGIGASHNETWDYQAVNNDWQNRTIRYVWKETGPDASEGEEWPERSPVVIDPLAPQANESLGNLTVGRESGLVPLPLIPGDFIDLADDQAVQMRLHIDELTTVNHDGREFSAVSWSGVYGVGNMMSHGNASGNVITFGPLNGLVSSASRNISVQLGMSGEDVVVEERQTLHRIISPSVVSVDDNHPPSIESIRLRNGVITGEGGEEGFIEVRISDTEFNVESVQVDLAEFGLPVLFLNDRGLDGDLVIGDDIYTASFIVSGLQVGQVPIHVVAMDKFNERVEDNDTLEVVNQGPRLIFVEFVPEDLERHQSFVINAKAYDGHGVDSVAVDLREFGGELTMLNQTGEIWAGAIEVPLGMQPGEHDLTIIMNDGLGQSAQTQTWLGPSATIGNERFGMHAITYSNEIPMVLTVKNDRPQFNTTTTTIEKNLDVQQVYTLQVEDPDGIQQVRVDLSVFMPIGQTGMVRMFDDGIQGGDKVAGDGIFSVNLTIREGTPIGAHEVRITALDTYGMSNETTAIIVLSVPTIDQSAPTGLSSGVMLAGGVSLLFAIGIIIFLSRRNQGGEKTQTDRFGFE